jgi:hypothetical protein
MKFLLFFLLTLPLFGKQSERYYQEKFAREIGGKVEVVMKDGTRWDILTAPLFSWVALLCYDRFW